MTLKPRDPKRWSREKAWALNDKNGHGSVLISYGKDTEILAPRIDVEHCIEDFRNMSRSERRSIMRSVNRNIARHFPAVAAGTATNEVAMGVMQDIAIWYAFEVFEGRASMEKH